MKALPERYTPFRQSVDYRVDTARKRGHHYSQGWYLVTICTYGRQPFFAPVSMPALPDSLADTQALAFYHGHLPAAGQQVLSSWNALASHHACAQFDSLVVMPDHIHGLLYLDVDNKASLGEVINGFKGACTRSIRPMLPQFGWQTRFHDRIVHTPADLEAARRYIWQNPFKAPAIPA